MSLIGTQRKKSATRRKRTVSRMALQELKQDELEKRAKLTGIPLLDKAVPVVKDDSKSKKLAAENESLKKEIEELQDEIKKLKEKIKDLK